MDGREVGSHPWEYKTDAPSLHRFSRQPLHEKSNGNHLPWIGRDSNILYVRHNCLCWNLVTDTATVRGLSVDIPDIPTWLGYSLHFISKRITQWGGGRFICGYCGNSFWCIAEQSLWDWNRSRATRQCTQPVLCCDEASVTGENRRRQSSRCNKNHGYWRGGFWRSAPRHTLSQDLHVQRETFGCQTIWPQQRMVDRTRCWHQDVESNDSEVSQIDHNAYIKTIQSQPHVWVSTQ